MTRVHLFAVAAMFAVASPALAQTTHVPNGELYRFTYSGTYPMGCYDASTATAKLRTKNSEHDPDALVAAAKAFIACANGPYGERAAALYNQAMFSAAAATLLAARQQTGKAAHDNAVFARDATTGILGFKRGPASNGMLTNPNTPSMLSTNALRMHNDAVTLLHNLKGASGA